jgi:esterase/lipase superfamily enzyme
MKRETFHWISSNLRQEMEIITYGTYGFAILLLPTFSDNPEENEEGGLIDSITPFIEKGKCKVFSIGGVNYQSWLNREIPPAECSERHFQYNNYIIEEVVPFIFGNCGCPVPIITCGAAIGAYHAANNFFRRPDIFYGMISMSGTFNIEHYTNGYYDDNCYFNSPIHYLPNLIENYWLSFLLMKHHIYIVSGSGYNENPNNSLHLGNILSMKGIPHVVDIWGSEWGHSWESWNKMLPHFIENRF